MEERVEQLAECERRTRHTHTHTVCINGGAADVIEPIK